MYPFSPGSFAPRNGWYVIAFPHEITDALMTRWVLGDPVVLYRKQDGTAVAVGGRCPHRHYPLGESKRVGDAIQCGYHGITFGPDGRCTRVPSQNNVPGVYRIPSYPLVEKGLWMWIWPGDPALADESLIPTPEEIGLTAPGFHARAFYSLTVDGRYQLLNDNLLDLSHLGFLHGTTIGTDENASTPEERSYDGRVLVSRRRMERAAIPALMAELSGYDGPIDRVAGMDFYAPGFHSGLDETTVSPGHPRAGEMLNAAKVWHAVTPATHHQAHYFFAMAVTEEDRLDFMEEYLKPVVAEDVFATVEIEKIVRTMGDRLPQELMLKSDATAVQGRRILQAMMDRERETAAADR